MKEIKQNVNIIKNKISLKTLNIIVINATRGEGTAVANMEIKYRKLHPDARIPLHGSEDAAGYDLYCTSMRRSGDIITCGTGLAVEIPKGYFGALYARSSIYKTGWEKVGGVCVIDADYRGEIYVLFRDLHATGLVQPYEVGDRIAQLVIQPCMVLHFVEQDTLTETARGNGGYGSTGRR